MKPKIKAFFDEPTSTISYVVAVPEGDRCAIIDPVLDYDPRSGRISTLAADLIIEYVRDTGLKVDWILETHDHADQWASPAYLKENLDGRIAIGEHVTIVQQTFKKLFNLDDSFVDDGSQFDHLFVDGERFAIGGLSCDLELTWPECRGIVTSGPTGSLESTVTLLPIPYQISGTQPVCFWPAAPHQLFRRVATCRANPKSRS